MTLLNSITTALRNELNERPRRRFNELISFSPQLRMRKIFPDEKRFRESVSPITNIASFPL